MSRTRHRTAATAPETAATEPPTPAATAPPDPASRRRPAASAIASTPRSSRSPPGLSRIAGLVREIVAASYFGTSGAASAFTIAFQVPNLVRALFADAALQRAFVPVFTELLEQGRKREAFQLASTLFGLILAVLGDRDAALHRRRAG